VKRRKVKKQLSDRYRHGDRPLRAVQFSANPAFRPGLARSRCGNGRCLPSVNAENVYGGGTNILGGWAHFGYAGVDAFFVVSGFIMATVTSGRFGSLSGAIDFLAKRVIRVYPLYWLCSAVILVMLFLRPSSFDPALADKSVAASLLLLPMEGGPLLVVGWTLTYELYFYTLTAMALAMSSERRVPALLSVWAAALVAAQLVPVQGPWLSLVASPLGFEFIAGVVVGLYWRRLSVRAAVSLLVASLVWVLTACGLLAEAPDRGQSAGVRALAFGPPAVFAVAALARVELAGKLPVPPPRCCHRECVIRALPDPCVCAFNQWQDLLQPRHHGFYRRELCVLRAHLRRRLRHSLAGPSLCRTAADAV